MEIGKNISAEKQNHVKINLEVDMKLMIKSTCLLVLMTANAFGEPTPAGTTPTYTTSAGNSFTYYYQNGSPVPPGVKLFISPAGTSQLIDDTGATIGNVYPTQADASNARETAVSPDCSSTHSFVAAGSVSSGCGTPPPDCSGPVVIGPGGMPLVCNSATSSSGTGSPTAVDDKAYDKASFELNTLLYGAVEIGSKSCTPAGTKMPGSLSSWWSAIKTYSLGEVNRDKTLNESVGVLQKKIQDLTGTNSVSKDMQTEAIQLQIDMVNASIESLNGNNGRIPLREKLLVASVQSTESNGKENIKTVDAWKNMVDITFVASLNAAKAACERKKKIKTCEKDQDEVETCTEKEVKDPVPGCDVAIAQIPVMRAGPAQQYGEIYITATPSTSLNVKMESFETDMTNIMAAIPRSNDSNYDWSSPMEDGLKLMKVARKDSGTKCPSAEDAKEKDKVAKSTKSFLASLGMDEDAKDDKSKAVAKAFGDVWGETDKVIGQAAFRGDYFKLVGKQINTLLVMDRSKLQTLLSTKTKLETYLKNIKTSLTAGAVAAAKPASAPSGSTTANPAKVTAAAAVGKSAQADTTIDKKNAAAVIAASSQTTSMIASPQTAIPKTNLSVSTTSSTSGGNVSASSGLSLGSASMALAKKSLEVIAKNDKKIAGMLQGTESSTGLTGTLPMGNKDSAKSKTVLASSNGSGAVVSAQTAADPLNGGIASAFKALSNDPKASEIYRTASNSQSEYSSDSRNYSGGGRPSYRTTTTTTTGYSTPPAHAAIKSTASAVSLPTSTKRPAGRNAISKSESAIEDGKLLSASIVAKKSKKRDEYTALENDSLFQRVTKAYIRNYEKVDGEPEAVETP